jgi:hypothetical protein
MENKNYALKIEATPKITDPIMEPITEYKTFHVIAYSKTVQWAGD